MHVTKAAVATLSTFAGVAAQMISKHMENTDTGKKMAASKDVQVRPPACWPPATPLSAPLLLRLPSVWPRPCCGCPCSGPLLMQ